MLHLIEKLYFVSAENGSLSRPPSALLFRMHGRPKKCCRRDMTRQSVNGNPCLTVPRRGVNSRFSFVQRCPRYRDLSLPNRWTGL